LDDIKTRWAVILVERLPIDVLLKCSDVVEGTMVSAKIASMLLAVTARQSPLRAVFAGAQNYSTPHTCTSSSIKGRRSLPLFEDITSINNCFGEGWKLLASHLIGERRGDVGWIEVSGFCHVLACVGTVRM